MGLKIPSSHPVPTHTQQSRPAMSTHTVRILFFLIIALLATAVVYTIIIWKLRHRLRRRAHVAPPVTPGVYGFNGVELHACDTRADMPAVVRHGLAEAKVRAKRGVVLGVEETIGESITQGDGMTVLMPGDMM